MRIKWVKALIMLAVTVGLAYSGYHAPEPGDQTKEIAYKNAKIPTPHHSQIGLASQLSRNSLNPGRRTKGYLINESFESDFPPAGWSTEVGSGSYDWEKSTSHAHTGSASAYFDCFYASSGYNSRLITSTISLTGTNPILSFWMYHMNYGSYYDDSLVVEIKVGNGDWTPLASYLRYTTSNTGWYEHTIDLSSYQGQTVTLAFHAYSDYGYSIYIDDVTVSVQIPNDVGVSKIISPTGVYPVGSTVTPKVEVTNYGTAENSFDVTVEIGSYTSTQNVTLSAGAVDTVTFPSYTLNNTGIVNVTAYTVLSTDENTSNDTLSGTFTVADFVCNFENSPGGFQADPQSGTWEWGTPSEGPSSAYSGDKCWGTVLDGNYSNSADWYLYSPTLQALSDSVVLSFYQWYHIESGYDGGNVEISTDGGQTWTLVEPDGGYPDDNVYALGGPGFTGSTGAWELVTFDLSSYVSSGDFFQIRFHLASDGSVNYEGWYIDDFSGIGFQVFVPSYDVGINKIIAPQGFYTASDTVTSAVEVQNFGNTDAAFSVTFKVYKGSNECYSEVQNVSVAPGEVDTVVFSTYAMSEKGLFEAVFYTTYTQDVNNSNDTARATFFVPNEINDFDECLFPPIGWASYILGDSLNNYGEPTGWDLWTDTTHYGHGDPYEGCSIWHNDDNVADSCNDWIVKGPIYVADSNAAIAFYQSGYWISYTHYHGLWISVNDPDPRNGNFSELVDLTDSTPSARQWSMVGPLTELGNYVGDTVYIAFVYRGDYDDEWYIDNVMLIGAYSLPNDITVGGTPIASHDTLGLGTTTLYSYVWNPPSSNDSLTFRLNVTITHNGAVVYNHFTTVSQLAPGETRIVYFSPDFVPYESGEYIYTLTAAVPNDPFPTNNMIVDTFYVDLYGGGQSGETMIPRTFSLRLLSPNPLKGPVTLSFDVAKATHVSLRIYDVSGRTVANIASGMYNPGRYTLKWNGKTSNGTEISEGIYFIEYRAGDFKTVKKIAILR